ncbi:AzlC family ABC transporter permease [Actinokineospora globicatena]|uniref:Branched-chain amino acid ABC transporter permease n=1 Tax=Actinokineospora globicatena TaxID=103729 RepID=A0A9W6QLX3_9PSEU|nr:AzlC family ABC transporter permease [Actinokineospora globicatena]MCP2304188.1 4-azaleucine resistance probable transporter AzlC [Actinokineospora globicatena]GLW78454.1 branched-chain amino acid ABC transporter permease [Actinokineospora globicatena]GLW84882.1 branched-chain amino acid ABC transporter permease [Actinokineospora globicatena]GLW91060.1 branched-chain amino acid ABC transporter permease [Actinokineospora globicatena]
MRSIWRTLDPGLWRGVLAIAAAAAVNGASFGAIAVAAGNPLWVPVAMSVLVFAGGSQYMAVGVVASGGSPIAAVIGGLVLNARHLPFGLAIGDVVGKSLPARLVGSHLLVDESVAFAMAQKDPERAKAAYWACGGSLFVAWNLGVFGGALAGSLVSDPNALGLDAVFPAVMLALVLPALKEAGKLRPALLGAAIALATTPFLPPGVPVLLALLGLVAVPRRTGTPETTDATGVTA